MSLSSGFFNSVNHDRLYNAEDMSRLFDGLIRDGVFASIGTCMVVKANTKMTVNVGVGRAWFNHTWTLNDSILPVTLGQSHVLWPRIDAVVLEVNSEESVRLNSIKVVQGEPSTNPKKPTLTKTTLVNQYPLAYITVSAAATEIRQADIENAVGTTECPFVSGILSVISIEELIPQWKDILNRFVEENTANFNTWMNNEKTAYAQWLQSNKDDYNKLVKDQTTSYQTWFDGIKNNYTNWFASIKEAYDTNWETFQQWESTSKSEYSSWFAGVKSTYDTNWKEFQAWETKTKDDFDAWYESVKNQLSGDVVAKLNDRIDQINAKMLSLIDASEGTVEGTVEAPVLLANADASSDGYDIVSAGPKLLTGTVRKYPGTAHNGGSYDVATQTVTFGSEDNSGAFLSLNNYIYLKSGEEYTLSVDVEASAAISGALIGADVKGTEEDDKYITTLPAGKSTQTFDFTYSGTGLAFVCYASGMSGKTVKLSNMKILRKDVAEDDYGLYQNTNSVHIGPDTKFPLYGLRSYEGNTTIISSKSSKNFEAYVVDQYNGKALLESAKLGVEAKREKVGLIKSNSKYLPGTIKAPLMVTGATRNLLNPTAGTKTQNGVTCAKNPDGSYTLSGTPTEETVFVLCTGIHLDAGVTYRGVITEGMDGPIEASIQLNKEPYTDYFQIYAAPYYVDQTYTPSEDLSDLRFIVKVSVSPEPSVNVKIKPMLTTDLNATYYDFVPYSGYDIKTCGKNLVKCTLSTITRNGVTITNNCDGTYTLNGTATDDINMVSTDLMLIKGFTYVFMLICSNTIDGLYTYITNRTGDNVAAHPNTITKFVYAGSSTTHKAFHLAILKNSVLNNVLIKPMITRDLEATYDDFEPYVEGPTVHIDSSTEFPLMDLEAMEGETNIISPANVETYHTDDENGKALLETIYKAANSGGIYYDVNPPTGTFKKGDIWVWPSRNMIKYYNGSKWAETNAWDADGGDIVKSSGKPTTKYRACLWIDSANGNAMKYVEAHGGKVTELAAGGVSVGATAPSNTKLLWIDTSSGGVAKYYNGSVWVATASVWG